MHKKYKTTTNFLIAYSDTHLITIQEIQFPNAPVTGTAFAEIRNCVPEKVRKIYDDDAVDITEEEFEAIKFRAMEILEITKKENVMRVYNKECDCGICGICTGQEAIHEQDKLKGDFLWQTHSIDDVFSYFVGNYKPPVGTKIESFESFYDAQKGTVVFRLYLKNK